MIWTAALQAAKERLATARPKTKATHRTTNGHPSSLLKRSLRRRLALGGSSALLVMGLGIPVALSGLHHTGWWVEVYRDDGGYLGLVPDTNDVSHRMKRVADGQFSTHSLHTNVPLNYDWKQVAPFPTKAASIGITDVLQPEDAKRYLLYPSSAGQIAGRASSPAALSLSEMASTSSGLEPLLSVQSTATVTKTVSLPYHVRYVRDARLPQGSHRVVISGQPGLQIQSVQEVYINGVESTSCLLFAKAVLRPVEEVVHHGTGTPMGSGSWAWPTACHVITSPFGYRSLHGGEMHPGIDIGVPIGTPIYATHEGTVLSAGWNTGGYGEWVEVNNGSGITTIFGHMSQVVAHCGEAVTQGQLIGYSGQSGEATGPHLHYEVRINGTPVNPMAFA